MICAFQEGDTQFPCDPGCCLTEATEEEKAATEEASTTAEELILPWWAIILLIIAGLLFLIGLTVLFAWSAKKMSRRSSNGR
jgi:flagellar basal body-associated protein FliL